jgi:hypothetical protein
MIYLIHNFDAGLLGQAQSKVLPAETADQLANRVGLLTKLDSRFCQLFNENFFIQCYFQYMKKKLRAFFKNQAAYNFVVPPIVAALFRALRDAVNR